MPTRGSMLLDAIFVAMFGICVVMLLSIGLVRFRQQFALHRKIQIGLSLFLLVAIVLFEVDVRFLTDWRSLASESRFYASGMVDGMLIVHLMFAVPTPFVWGYVVVQAVRKFPTPVGPSDHSRQHRFWGRIAAGMMGMTALTGCLFYWMAFVG